MKPSVNCNTNSLRVQCNSHGINWIAVIQAVSSYCVCVCLREDKKQQQHKMKNACAQRHNKDERGREKYEVRFYKAPMAIRRFNVCCSCWFLFTNILLYMAFV